jgi:hypothetical protein
MRLENDRSGREGIRERAKRTATGTLHCAGEWNCVQSLERTG